MEEANGTTGVATAAARAKPGKYLGFNLGKQLFGLEILKVREIVCALTMTPVPRAGSSIRGVINLRGKIIPVVDLGVKLGMNATEQHERTCFIVVDVDRGGAPAQMAVLVDAVSEVLGITSEQIQPAPDLASAETAAFMLGIAQVKGTVRVLLDIEAVLATLD